MKSPAVIYINMHCPIFDITAEQAIAIEDTEANQEAALKEEIICYLFAGEYATTAHNLNAINSLHVIKNLI